MTYDNANVAGDIRYVGDRIANAGNYINNVLIQRRPVTLTPPAAFFHPLQANYYAAIAL